MGAAIKKQVHWPSLITNIAIWLVLSMMVLIQFDIFWDTVISDAFEKANLQAEFLSRSAKSLPESADLLANFSSTVSSKILVFDPEAGTWNFRSGAVAGHQQPLNETEGKVLSFMLNLVGTNGLVRFDGQGFVMDGRAEFTAGDSQGMAVVSMEAGGLVRRLVKGFLLMALILAVIPFVLFLRSRLFVMGINRAFQGEFIEEAVKPKKSLRGISRRPKDDFLASYQQALENLSASESKRVMAGTISGDASKPAFEIYRDVIFAVSQGKILLAGPDEIQVYVNAGDHMLDVLLQGAGDVPMARDISRRVMADLFPHQEGIKRALIGISEIAGNIIKHCGSGIFELKKVNQETLRFVFRDQGPGMDLKRLPWMLFFKGYSTSKSMGCGYTLVCHYLDRVIISTSEIGTTVCFDIQFRTA